MNAIKHFDDHSRIKNDESWEFLGGGGGGGPTGPPPNTALYFIRFSSFCSVSWLPPVSGEGHMLFNTG